MRCHGGAGILSVHNAADEVSCALRPCTAPWLGMIRGTTGHQCVGEAQDEVPRRGGDSERSQRGR
jgi:hypothetical protein